MKSTDTFKQIIQEHLEAKAANDAPFAEKFAAENKNIDDCITYILNQVQKSGCNGFSDSEIFGMAIHYYDEAAIEVGKPIKCKVVVNHSAGADMEPEAQAKQTPQKEAKKQPQKANADELQPRLF